MSRGGCFGRFDVENRVRRLHRFEVESRGRLFDSFDGLALFDGGGRGRLGENFDLWDDGRRERRLVDDIGGDEARFLARAFAREPPQHRDDGREARIPMLFAGFDDAERQRIGNPAAFDGRKTLIESAERGAEGRQQRLWQGAFAIERGEPLSAPMPRKSGGAARRGFRHGGECRLEQGAVAADQRAQQERRGQIARLAQMLDKAA